MKSNEPVLKDDYCSLDDVIVQDKTIYDKTVNFNPVETTLYQQSKDYISNNLDAFIYTSSLSFAELGGWVGSKIGTYASTNLTHNPLAITASTLVCISGCYHVTRLISAYYTEKDYRETNGINFSRDSINFFAKSQVSGGFTNIFRGITTYSMLVTGINPMISTDISYALWVPLHMYQLNITRDMGLFDAIKYTANHYKNELISKSKRIKGLLNLNSEEHQENLKTPAMKG